MNILILGGDGYLGWPTAMNLSQAGHQVTVADNYLRRQLCQATDSDPLFEVPNLQERARLWKELSGQEVQVRIGDLNDWDFMASLMKDQALDTIIHYAEQPSAPYSMLDRSAAELTLKNNIGVTFNVIQAMAQHASDAHLVKLGTMGEYGTPDIDIEEGWIDIEHKGRSGRFLFPRAGGSLYHTTKILDTDLLWFYVRTWDLRVTDLMQGPVYGLLTQENRGFENRGQESLLSFFNYDDIFGTVLNRFIVQAVAGHPLTVYGKGGQTRGYLNIVDTLQCVRLAVENSAAPGELRIFNQFVETFSVNELAKRVRDAASSIDLPVTIQEVTNPRRELEEHYYNPSHTGLTELGLKPTPLSESILVEILELVAHHKQRIHPKRIVRDVKWKR